MPRCLFFLRICGCAKIVELILFFFFLSFLKFRSEAVLDDSIVESVSRVSATLKLDTSPQLIAEFETILLLEQCPITRGEFQLFLLLLLEK